MSTNSLSSCRRNLLPQFVLDPNGINTLSQLHVRELSYAQIQKLAKENPAFAAKIEQIKPMKDRTIECLEAEAFFKTPGLVKDDFLQSMAFELARAPEERRFFLYERCIQHVLGQAEDNKEAYLLALKAVSSSRVSGLFRKTLLCNPSLMHVVDLGPFLVNLCDFRESYEGNLQAFCELYDLKKINPESLAKVLCKVAEFKNAELFEKLCNKVFDGLPVAFKCDVALSTLNIYQHSIFGRIWSQDCIGQMNPQQVVAGLKIAASHGDAGNFIKLLLQSLDGSHDPKNIQVAKCAFLHSAQFSDPAIFNRLVVYAERFQLSPNDLGQMLEYASSCCNEEVIAFVFHHEKFSEIDEYYLGQALIKAAQTENISLAARLLRANRVGNIESSFIETAFIEGVLKKQSNLLLELFREHNLLCQVQSQALCEAIKFFAKKGEAASYRLPIPIVGSETLHTVTSMQDLARLLEIYAELELCDLIAEILETNLLERLPFPMMQRLFDFAFAKHSKEVLKVIFNSSKSSQLHPKSIFEALKRLIELNELSFFEIAAIEFLQALPTRFPNCSDKQKVELVRVIGNLAITVDRSAVLKQIIEMEEFQSVEKTQIDVAISYAYNHKRSNCLDLMINSVYFNRVSEGVAQQVCFEPK